MTKSTRPLLWVALLALATGCRRAEPQPGETAPPAAVKWHTPSEAVLEEWTELVGTTVPLPDRVARVSAPIEGRVAAILGEANGAPLAEGQRVEKGAVLVRLDDTI